MSETESAPAENTENQPEVQEQGESHSLRAAFEEAAKDHTFTEESPAKEKEEKPEPEARQEETKEASPKEEKPTLEQKIDYEKSYKEIQAAFTRDRQEASRKEKDFADKLKGFQDKAKLYDDFDQMVRNNPAAYKALEQAFSGVQNIDPAIQGDPLFHYIQNMQKQVGREMNDLKQFKESVLASQRESQTKSMESHVDQALNKVDSTAKEQYKAMFGEEISNDDMSKIYQTFIDTGINPTPELTRAIVRDLYFDKHVENERQKALGQNMAKKGISGRVTSASSNKAPQKAQIRDLRSAFDAAWDSNQ